ncbi:PREDICTED: uncharacterized protein LOC108506291 [Lepidothrix coronata]|uniref:Uncharacterized protein LOC108506291 n=1 Tax=Lepidothrix coronata TaxID=321398 RepID=A0A6J0IPH3_9PASS|nr:PREDICTED: uncharacterized protein LOC108506291 [Lepidothrix coronata]
MPPPRGPGLGRRRCRVPSPPTVEPSSNRGPRRSGTRGRAALPGAAAGAAPAGLHGECAGTPFLPGTFLLSRTPFPETLPLDRSPPHRRDGVGSAGIFPRALSSAVLLLLLVAVLSRGRRCNIAKILQQYRAVIFHEIQNLKNLSGSMHRSGRAGPACRSDKDQKILLSIYNISMSLREVGAGTLHSHEELAVWKVAKNTDFVLRENCRKISKTPLRSTPAQPRRGRPGRRRKQLREIGRKADRLATCWEKLYALHAPHQAPRHS